MSEMEIWKPSAALSPERMSFLLNMAKVLAKASVVPATLKHRDGNPNKELLPVEEIEANVFLVCELADRWQISPIALLGSVAIIRGKLAVEGKVIGGILELNAGIALEFEYSGTGPNRKIIASGEKTPGKRVSVEGTVSQWSTDGPGSPWRNPLDHDRQLAYRAMREWARIHKPSILLGVLTIDEARGIELETAAQNAKEIELVERYKPKEVAAPGFNPKALMQEVNEVFSTATTEFVGEMVSYQPPEQTTAPAEASATTGASGYHPEPDRLPAGILVGFSEALFRVSGADRLDTMVKEYWKKQGGWPATEIDKKISGSIVSLHKKRFDGTMSIDQIRDEVAKITETADAV